MLTDRNNYQIENFNSSRVLNPKNNRETSFDFNIKNKSNEELYKTINSYIIKDILSENLIKNFLFTPIPENSTLSSNINIKKRCLFSFKKDLNDKIFNYDYEQELVMNNKIFLIGKISKIFKKIKIKIYMTIEKKVFKYLGKIESNLIRNKFIFYLGENKANYKKNLKINYDINIFGLSGLRSLIVETYNNNKSSKFNNKKPIWNPEFKKFVLDFNQRVRLRHYKNFILENDKNITVLQCGKIEKNKYALDFQFPFAPIQAFVIGISSIINKISC